MRRRIPMILSLCVVAGISLGGMTWKANGGPDLKPLCNQPSNGMPAEKLRLLQEKCAWEQQPSVAKPQPYTPSPTVVQPTLEMGIIEQGVHIPLAKNKFTILNAWANDELVIYAGALTSDPTQGVVFVVTRADVTAVQSVYNTPTKDGAVRFVSENGTVLTLLAKNGIKYSFSVTEKAFTRT